MLKAKVETNTKTKSKHKEEKLSNPVEIVSCFIETSINESLVVETETFGSQSQLSRPRLSEVSLSFKTETEKLLMVETEIETRI